MYFQHEASEQKNLINYSQLQLHFSIILLCLEKTTSNPIYIPTFSFDLHLILLYLLISMKVYNELSNTA